jgi:hypothetical protein
VAVVLAAATTYAQVNFVGVHFLRVQQQKVHLQMLGGTAGNPWQYRILADLMVEPIIRLARQLNIPQPQSFSFIVFRFLQCVLIFAAGAVYYRKLGLSLYASLIGLSVLAWSMSYSLYNSDLSFNVFFDVAFYLLAAILIIDRRYLWLIVLMIPAALNRETSLLIPFMLFFSVRYARPPIDDRRGWIPAIAAGLAVYTVSFIGLRVLYGPQQYLTADGYYPGVGLLVLNLSRWETWAQIFITLGIVPFLGIFAYRAWPRTLRVFFWVIVPVWFAVHFLAALVAETRLLLVPQALVFIPAASFGLSAPPAQADASQPSST